MNDDNLNSHLIVIGGAEDKKGECDILKKVVEAAGAKDGVISIITTATKFNQEAGSEYKRIFEQLGMKNIEIIDIEDRQEALLNSNLEILERTTCVFFTGGDQLRITSVLGGSPVYEKLRELYEKGVTIVGTSAGASVMSSTMIVNGPDNDTPRKCTVKMAPGLGFIRDAVIDQHFAQRGRIGRLLTAMAQNPNLIGIGIDENTAIDFAGDKFKVIGDNAVTVLDGREISHINVSELKPDEILVLSNIRLHILPKCYGFDMKSRKVFKESEKIENTFN